MAVKKKALESLVRLDSPLQETLAALDACDSGIDCDPLVTLTRADVANVLQRFLDNALTADDVDGWAAALEMRDDVDFGGAADSSGLVFDIVSDISTARTVAGPLTAPRAREWLARLAADGEMA